MASLYQHFKEFDLSLNQTPSLFHQSHFGAEISRTHFEQVLNWIKSNDFNLFAELTHPYSGLYTQPSATDATKVLVLSTYSHSRWYTYGRVFSKFTSMERQLRFLLFRYTLVELDAANFVPETLHQISQKMQPKLHCPALTHFVTHREQTYAKVAALGLTKEGDTAKTFVLKLLNQAEGDKLPPHAHFLRQLQRELHKIKIIFDTANLDITIAPDKTRKNETALSRWVDTLEVNILEIVVSYLQKNKLVTNCIPIHDGVLVDKNSSICLNRISDLVYEETGFRYKYKLKELKPNVKSLFYLI